MPTRSEWLRSGEVAGAVALFGLVFAIYLLDDQTVASGPVLAGLAVTAASFSVPSAVRTWPPARTAWLYVTYVVALLIVWRARPTALASAEVGRQLLFLNTLFATASLASTRRLGPALVAAHLIGLALVLFQIPGPRSGVDHLGRAAFYHALEQWSGYPEIGLLMSLGGSATVALALSEPRVGVRVAAAVLALTFGGATIFLQSRSAVIAIGIVAVWLTTIAFVKWRSRTAIVAAVALAAGIAWFAARGPTAAETVQRASGTFSRETGIRALGWKTGSEMFREHPFLGVGLGRYPEEYKARDVGTDSTHAYNIVIHVAAETGLVGLVPYLILWGRVLWVSLRKSGRDRTGPAAFAVHAMLLGFFVRSQSEHFLANLETSFRLLLLLGTLFGLAEGLPAKRDSRAD